MVLQPWSSVIHRHCFDLSARSYISIFKLLANPYGSPSQHMLSCRDSLQDNSIHFSALPHFMGFRRPVAHVYTRTSLLDIYKARVIDELSSSSKLQMQSFIPFVVVYYNNCLAYSKSLFWTSFKDDIREDKILCRC